MANQELLYKLGEALGAGLRGTFTQPRLLQSQLGLQNRLLAQQQASDMRANELRFQRDLQKALAIEQIKSQNRADYTPVNIYDPDTGFVVGVGSFNKRTNEFFNNQGQLQGVPQGLVMQPQQPAPEQQLQATPINAERTIFDELANRIAQHIGKKVTNPVAGLGKKYNPKLGFWQQLKMALGDSPELERLRQISESYSTGIKQPKRRKGTSGKW